MIRAGEPHPTEHEQLLALLVENKNLREQIVKALNEPTQNEHDLYAENKQLLIAVAWNEEQRGVQAKEIERLQAGALEQAEQSGVVITALEVEVKQLQENNQRLNGIIKDVHAQHEWQNHVIRELRIQVKRLETALEVAHPHVYAKPGCQACVILGLSKG